MENCTIQLIIEMSKKFSNFLEDKRKDNKKIQDLRRKIEKIKNFDFLISSLGLYFIFVIFIE